LARQCLQFFDAEIKKGKYVWATIIKQKAGWPVQETIL
jgi:hypothetical protein